MYEIVLFNVKYKKEFRKIIWNYREFMNFLRKCEHSKKLKIIAWYDHSWRYS